MLQQDHEHVEETEGRSRHDEEVDGDEVKDVVLEERSPDNTTATLLLKAKVPLATVQRILRHSDPRLTSEVYGHLDLDDMREGLKALDFGPLPERAPAPVLPLRKGPSSATFATHLLPAASIPKAENPDRSPNPETTRGVGLAGETGFEDVKLQLHKSATAHPFPAKSPAAGNFQGSSESARVLADPLRSTSVVETLWRRIRAASRLDMCT